MIYDGDNSNDDAEMELVERMAVRMEMEQLRLRIITMMVIWKGVSRDADDDDDDDDSNDDAALAT